MLPVVILLVMTTLWTPAKAIKDYLQKHYPWPSVDVSHVVAEGSLPAYPPEQIVVRRGPVGRAEFVFIYKGRSIVVKARIDAKDWVLKTARPVMKGQPLQKDDLYPALVNVKRIPRGAVSSWQDLRGKVLRRSLQANSIITTTVLKNRPVIKRGDRVLLVYRIKGLRVTAMGLARESGAVGESISVINLSSKRYIKGVVEDEGVVSIIR